MISVGKPKTNTSGARWHKAKPLAMALRQSHPQSIRDGVLRENRLTALARSPRAKHACWRESYLRAFPSSETFVLFTKLRILFSSSDNPSGEGQDVPACKPAIWQACEKVYFSSMSSLLCEHFQNIQLYFVLSSFTIVVDSNIV